MMRSPPKKFLLSLNFNEFARIFFIISDKPHNPMINSGAILTAALIKSKLSAADKFDFVSTIILRRLSYLVGHFIRVARN